MRLTYQPVFDAPGWTVIVVVIKFAMFHGLNDKLYL